MNYTVIDPDHYYRKDVFRHFTGDCKCSTSITNRVDVTPLAEFSRRTGTRFYLNFLYVLARALNAREDYRLTWRHDTRQLILWDKTPRPSTYQM